ncbi:acid protease [Wolfiporia cocos MD-104 SS10]|uniref:Acid protease n=1 Tax=Wolfiporia cocos (strain MD-104) TaxID=742152 RepID=A0A2H3JCC1_WOLCO|nr:acid protease [Wolfiporia cocos MD-104 SS10]
MRSLLPFALLCLLLDARFANALTFPVRTRTASQRRSGSGLHSRSNNDTLLPVKNTQNSEYISNITLGGREIPVLLDTGSSDLWVTGTVPNTNDLGKSVSLSYAVGDAAGDVNTATLNFGNYTVENQAYLLVTDTASFSINIAAEGFEGLIGLGPNTGSVIRDKIGDSRGDSVLDRIFQQNASDSNYMTVLLNREGDPKSPPMGQMSISEIVPGYEDVTSMPKLTVEKVHRLTDLDQHWQTYTDVNGVIGPDGNPIKVESIVPSAPDGQLVVVFDSGYTLPQVPRDMSDAIYGRVQGAEYDTTAGVWLIPCDQMLNISFKFGGHDYPVHPLDTSSSEFDMVFPSTGEVACVGAFQPISSSAFSLLGEYDIILGMSFIRNVYALFDYGNFVEDTDHDLGEPFIQLLSTTNLTEAHETFVQVRMSGVDNTGAKSQWLLPVSQEVHSPETEAEKKEQYEEYVLSRWPEIFVGCLAFVIIVMAIIIWRCCFVRRRRRAAQQDSSLLPTAAGRPQSSYKQLEDPSTATLVDMQRIPPRSPSHDGYLSGTTVH